MHYTTLVRSRSRGIGDGLTYDAADLSIVPGTLVRVPLRNKKVEGIVLRMEDAAASGTDFTVKAIDSVVGDHTLLTPAQLILLRWMAGYYACSLRQAVSAFLPGQPWSGLLKDDGRSREPWLSAAGTKRVLSDAQIRARDEILASDRPSLLFGATGSGKTEIYADVIARTAMEGKQSIVLVPEILLTEHIIRRFQNLFAPDQIAVLHSRLTLKERRAAWRAIRSETVALVIGSRSALFAPCPNLGLIVIDEEHEWTYKNERAPRYHARETAEALAAAAAARLVLGSATPSIDAWSRVKTGRYSLVRLPERWSGQEPARVRVVDLAVTAFGQHYPFSPPLLDAIRTRLAQREQTVLFLNRRGMASALLCLHCRRRVLSPASQVPFTIHRSMTGQPYLLDHVAGVKADLPAVCPSCGSPELRLVGAGTQRLEDILRNIFPNARVLRADSDILRHPEQMRTLLHRMEQREADILLGTQSVVKGLDLPGVTLAAVMIADIGLSLPHFRAGERVFQLLSQLIGRSGRAQPGEVIIQTFRPDAPEVRAAAEHRIEEYLDTELQMRMKLHYPPATSMIRLIIAPPDAASRAQALHRHLLDRNAKDGLGITCSCAPTLFGAGKTWHVLLRGQNPRLLLQGMDLMGSTIDIDPLGCL